MKTHAKALVCKNSNYQSFLKIHCNILIINQDIEFVFMNKAKIIEFCNEGPKLYFCILNLISLE